MSATAPAVAGARCSALARHLAEPLAGTAPLARSWLVLEQPGPWGAKALLDSHLDHRVGQRLTTGSAGTGVTVVLARRPGPHPDDHVGHRPRRVWLAHSGPERSPWLRSALVDDAAVLLALDLEALGRGEEPSLGAPDPDELLLVCTNGRRDACCALAGRPTAERLAAERPGRVWEASHLGGHRFAPTLLSLPQGWVHGGTDAASMALGSCRGRTCLSREAQAAELAVLAGPLVAPVPRPLTVSPVPGDDGRWLVDDGDRRWQVDVQQLPLDPARPESCGKGPVERHALLASVLPDASSN